MLNTLLNCFIDLLFTLFHCSAGRYLITLTGLFNNRNVGGNEKIGQADGAEAVGRPHIALKVSHYFVKFNLQFDTSFTLLRCLLCLRVSCPCASLTVTRSFLDLTARQPICTQVFCLALSSIMAGVCLAKKWDWKAVHYQLGVRLLQGWNNFCGSFSFL